jgi:integrase
LVNARHVPENEEREKRTVPISAELEKMIKEEASGKFFNVDYVSFCKILKMVKPDIPPNQATHILRHTFASHFVMNGGNIIALQRILGHANIQQIMTYVHLSQEYLQNAVALNPLAGGISL